VLTKITKYSAAGLLVLALGLGYLDDKAHHDNSSADFAKKVDQTQRQTISAPTPKPAPKAENDLLSTQPTVATNGAK
jgi:preprotein translocase subunit SecG